MPGGRREEGIEMSEMGSVRGAPPPHRGSMTPGPSFETRQSRRLEKSLSQPAPRIATSLTPIRDPLADVSRPPPTSQQPRSARPPFTRAQSIRERCEEFVGIQDQRREGDETDKWADKRLQFLNRRYKLSKDFYSRKPADVDGPGLISSPAVVGGQFRLGEEGSSSAYPAHTPMLPTLEPVEGRARSSSIDSRTRSVPQSRESFFKIVKEAATNIVTKGRLTPTAASLSSMRNQRTLQGQTSFYESPLPTLSSPAGGATPFGFPSMTPSVFRDTAQGAPLRGGGPMEHHLSRLAEEQEETSMAEESTEPERKEEEAEGEGSGGRASWTESFAMVDLSPERREDDERARLRGAGDDEKNEEVYEEETGRRRTEAAAVTVIEVPSPSSMYTPQATILPKPPPLSIPLARPSMLPMAREYFSMQSQYIGTLTDDVFFDFVDEARQPRLDDIFPVLVGGQPPTWGGARGLGSGSLHPQRAPVELGRTDRVADAVGPPLRPPPSRVGGGPAAQEQPWLNKVYELVQKNAFDQHRIRQGGVGVLGRFFNRKMKPDEKLNPLLRHKLKRTFNERPFFTYWVTTTQIVICVLSLLIFGIGPFSVQRSRREKEVPYLDGTLVTVGVYEKGNIFLGPRFGDLILLGAKYTPCMRNELKIAERIKKDEEEEKYTGCCIHTEGGICYQASEQACPRSFATLYRTQSSVNRVGLKKSASAPDLTSLALTQQRGSEVVCGLDPEYCDSPIFTGSDITQWPICVTKRSDDNGTALLPKHMKCAVQGHPCCIHLQGRCRITTKEYCAFVDGIYHENANLCSQVDCLPGICGMLPFFDGKSPNQLYRLVTALFVHAGLLHLAITIAFQFIFMRDLELYVGWIRIATIYFVSGTGGNLASAIFAPFNPEVGPAGSQAGVVAALLVDVYCNREKLENPRKAYLENGAWIVFLLVVGLMPWVDNWALLFGSIFGLLSATALFPDVGLSHGRPRRLLVVGVSISILVFLFVILGYIFVNNIHFECNWCSYFNCVNFGFFLESENEKNHFCDNQGLQLDSWLPI